MCGIFGVIANNEANISLSSLKNTVNQLFKLSESRGKEAAGLAMRTGREISVFKSPTSASSMLRTKKYNALFIEALNNGNGNKKINSPFAIIGHSRLVTNGLQTKNDNNQPVISNGVVGIHNGIIVNTEKLWAEHSDLKQKYDVDTEIIMSLMRKFYQDEKSLVEAAKKTFNSIEGAASVAVLFDDIPQVILGTNNGSMYLCKSIEHKIVIFASELYILQMLIRNASAKKMLGRNEISHVKPGDGYLINLSDMDIRNFRFTQPKDKAIASPSQSSNALDIVDRSPKDIKTDFPMDFRPGEVGKRHLIPASHEIHVPFDKLKRCTKCILPETFPFIEFDEKGVCNYCNNYRPINPKGPEALEKAVERYRRKNGNLDCLISLSGGRDSTYCLHYFKKVLNMNPITYTYDWGMVTDLARRNISRICGKLGIEHVLVSADINKKRSNIKKNIKAWLKRPNLGTIPLFMAGDKQFFYYANKLSKQTKVELVVFATNWLEKTDFKSGFCGVREGHNLPYYVSSAKKIKLALHYAKQFILNPSYLNSSMADSLWAFFSAYYMKHDYLLIFDYIKWDEQKIVSTLQNEYDWETAGDTKSTWRIGDGTASFYNYIYYTVAGFTENDTFRSNQIREGLITREKALGLVKEENQPRYDTIEWYFNIIGIPNLCYDALKVIDSIPKLYKI